MSMISTPDDATYPWYVRLIFWLQRRKYGAELEPAKLWGRTPRVFVALTRLYRTIDRASSPIEPALRSLVTVRVSQINWCEFCVDLNSATALERSVDAAKLSELADFDHSPRYSAREKAALRYAEAVTITDRRVDAAQMGELKTHFSDDAIIELTALIAFQNLSSKFNAALHVPAQGFCRMPPGSPDDVARQASQKIVK
ncbi:MAG: carboxymuconolactone decarboxylase family protein [Cupriavidus necator]